MEKAKKYAVLIAFFGILFLLPILHFALPDTELSETERRYLADAPELTVERVFSGKFFSEAETYLLEQFPGRDSLRAVKAAVELYAFAMPDSNDVYRVNGHLMRLEPELDETQVSMAIDTINAMLEANLDGTAYLSVIPDKNYFLAAQNGYLALDYDAMLGLVTSGVEAEYLDITGILDIEDYYRTDSHWRQEAILPVAQALCAGMGAPITGDEVYTPHSAGSFRGVYAGQQPLPIRGDDMVYLTSPALEAATVTDWQGNTLPVYNPDAVTENVDPYDLYLHGMQPVLTLRNPGGEGRLILFRDSFGSSIAPLLLDSYGEIVLVDLRYIQSDEAPNYVDFTDADVLVLLSTSILNAGALLR